MNDELKMKEEVLDLLYSIQNDKEEEFSKYRLLNNKFKDLKDFQPRITLILKKINDFISK